VTLSPTGLNLIKTSEGFRPQVYPDGVGKPTIGYGHLLHPGETFPIGITEAQATTLLLTDVAYAEHALEHLVKVPLTQGQYDALTSFTFNEGAGKLQGSTLLKLLNKGQYDAAGQQLLKWVYAGGLVEPGLFIRRNAELTLWRTAA